MSGDTARDRDEDFRRLALEAVRRDDTGVMLFGSVARGDHTPTSDFDVLELSQRRSNPYRVGRVNVSVYDARTLSALAENGSLFVLHLRLEGRVLRDPMSRIAECLAAYREPSTYEAYLDSLRSLLGLLDTNPTDYELRWDALNQIAFFIVRSVLYVRRAEAGDPTFAMATLAKHFPTPEFVTALSLKGTTEPDWERFQVARKLAETLLGGRASNTFGSVEAFLTNRAGENPLIGAFGLRLLGDEGFELTYDMLTFPPFGG